MESLWAPAIILLAVVNCNIFSLEAADGEGEVGPRPAAAEPVWNAGGPAGCVVDEKPGSLPSFLLVPGYVAANTLTGPAVESGFFSWRQRQRGWRLCHHDFSRGT